MKDRKILLFIKDFNGTFQINVGNMRSVKFQEIDFFYNSTKEEIESYINSFTDEEIEELKEFENRISCKNNPTRELTLELDYPEDKYFENIENSIYETHSDEDRIKKSLELLFKYSQIDGSHHKQWCINEVVKILKGSKEEYEIFVLAYMSDNWEKYWNKNNKDFEKTKEDIEINEEDRYEWNCGIAP